MRRHSHRVDVPVIPIGQPEDAKTKAYGAYARHPSPRPRRRKMQRWFGHATDPITPFNEMGSSDTLGHTRATGRTYYVRIAEDDTVWLDFSDGTTKAAAVTAARTRGHHAQP